MQTGTTREATHRAYRGYTSCGDLRATNAGERATLRGWVNRRRDHGGLIFIDLRDRYGMTQCTINPTHAPEAHAIAEEVRAEYVLEVTGEVVRRPDGAENPQIATGAVELLVDGVKILNAAKTPPFVIAEGAEQGGVDESLRLTYRYLDLRRRAMTERMILRHTVVKFMRDWLSARGFLGMDRYFQIARCMRDEDQRADRQLEFTQLDLEMSFVSMEDVLNLAEDLYTELTETVTDMRVQDKPWPRLSYADSMERYGNDRPDLRFGMELKDISDLVRTSEFGVFAKTVAGGGAVRGICLPNQGTMTRKEIDALIALAQGFGAKGLAYFIVEEQEGMPVARSPIAKFFTPEEQRAIFDRFEATPGDLITFIADEKVRAGDVLSRLRQHFGQALGLADPGVMAFAWLLEQPFVEWNADEQRWDAVHHPFVMPFEDDIPLMATDPGKMRAQQYDLVANGFELGSGSIRIAQRDLQERVFRLLNLDEEELQTKFGGFLRAFEYGAPPHGGIAPGIDRLIMLYAHEENIREVIAFPKNQSFQDLMLGAPSTVSRRQLDDLHIAIVPPEAGSD
ncbi:MAG: aspartate--tRNA ligase [Thermomicrobia bacterium]|nr:aspartate--tRNA ligase [Thermomicrobia bacterium]